MPQFIEQNNLLTKSLVELHVLGTIACRYMARYIGCYWIKPLECSLPRYFVLKFKNVKVQIGRNRLHS